MFKSWKKISAYLLFLVIVSNAFYILGVNSNGGDPTLDQDLGIFNFPWFNASEGVDAPNYYRNGQNLTAWIESISGGGVTDHGALTGLDDDDHSLYLLEDGSETSGIDADWVKLGGTNRTTWPTGGGSTADTEQPFSYLVFINATATYMVNGHTGAIDWWHTDPSIIFEAVDNNLTDGGRVMIKAGLYVCFMNPTSDSVIWEGEGYATHIKLPDYTNRSVVLLEGNNLYLKNFRVDGNQQNQNNPDFPDLNDGIEARVTIYNTTLEDMWIHDTLCMGIDTGLGGYWTYNWLIIRPHVWRNRANCITISWAQNVVVRDVDLSSATDVGFTTWHAKCVLLQGGRIDYIMYNDSCYSPSGNNHKAFTIENDSEYIWVEDLILSNCEAFSLANDAKHAYFYRLFIVNMTTHTYFGESIGDSYDLFFDTIQFSRCGPRILQLSGVDNVTLRNLIVYPDCILTSYAFQIVNGDSIIAEDNQIGPDSTSAWLFDLINVTNSEFYNNKLKNGGRGYSCVNVDDTIFSDDTIRNTGQGIKLDEDSDDDRITDETFRDISINAITIADANCNSTYINDCDFWGGVSNDVSDAGTGTVYGCNLDKFGNFDQAVEP